MSGKLLVTGAAGFVGSAVVRLLGRSSGRPRTFWDEAPVEHVVALLRPGGSAERLEELPPSKSLSIQYADLTDRTATLDLLGRVRPRAVVHLAVDRGIFQDLTQVEQDRINLTPLQTLCEGMARAGSERLIHTSSVWVLPAGERLDERTPAAPRSPYARAKALADEFLPTEGERTGVPWINLRLFNIFGRYEAAGRLLPYLVERLSRGELAQLSSGNQIRDFTVVEDIASAYVAALRADPSACGSVYHIGSGRGVSIRQFAHTVAAHVGDSSMIRFGEAETPDQDVPCQIADPTRARSVLGWAPEYQLESAIDETVRWWVGQRGRARALAAGSGCG